MLMMVHGHHAEEFFQRRPALHGAHRDIPRFHPVVNDRAQFRHLDESGVGNAAAGHILANVVQFALYASLRVGQARDASQNLRQIYGLDRNAVRLQNLFAVADGIKRRRTRSDAANAQITQAFHDAADGGKRARSLRNSAESGATVCDAVERIRRFRIAAGCCTPTFFRRNCRGGI